jgi:predicted RecA/RadA family phage recombinase
MATNYDSEGKVVQYTAGADISSGDVVVMGNILGVALNDIDNGDTGSVAIEGVFTVPKVTDAVIAVGESLTYDISASKFDDKSASAAAGDITGAAAVAVEAGVNLQTTIRVKLTGVPGTIETG